MSSTAHPEALPHRRPFEMPGWGVTLVAVLVLIAGVAAGVLIGYNSAPEAAPATSAAATVPSAATVEGLADAETVALVDNMMAAWTSGDGREAASYFTKDAVHFNDIGGYTVEGTKEITKAATESGRAGLTILRDSPVVDSGGGYVASSFQWNGGAGIQVLQIRWDGLIAGWWVYGY